MEYWRWWENQVNNVWHGANVLWCAAFGAHWLVHSIKWLGQWTTTEYVIVRHYFKWNDATRIQSCCELEYEKKLDSEEHLIVWLKKNLYLKMNSNEEKMLSFLHFRQIKWPHSYNALMIISCLRTSTWISSLSFCWLCSFLNILIGLQLKLRREKNP